MGVQQATWVAMETGDKIRVDMQVGHHKVAVTSAVDDIGGDLEHPLERLVVKIQEVAFVRTPAGGEIRATMRLGGRSYQSSWAMEEADGEPALGDLLDELGRAVLANLQSSLAGPNVQEEGGVRPRQQRDWEPGQQDRSDAPQRSWDTNGAAPALQSIAKMAEDDWRLVPSRPAYAFLPPTGTADSDPSPADRG